MNVGIGCCVVSLIFTFLNETCVMSILMPASKCKKIHVNGSMSVGDGDYDAVKECDAWSIDVNNSGGGLFQDNVQKTVMR